MVLIIEKIDVRLFFSLKQQEMSVGTLNKTIDNMDSKEWAYKFRKFSNTFNIKFNRMVKSCQLEKKFVNTFIRKMMIFDLSGKKEEMHHIH